MIEIIVVYLAKCKNQLCHNEFNLVILKHND